MSNEKYIEALEQAFFSAKMNDAMSWGADYSEALKFARKALEDLKEQTKC